jgi:YjbE family integral membrane protein
VIELFQTAQFWISLGQILAINLVLSGDNALVIAMFARSLPPGKQKQAIFWGSLAAVIIRMILTIAVFELLRLPYMKIVGGALLLRIAGQMLLPEHEAAGDHAVPPVIASTLYVIMLANLAMGLDNVLGVAAAAADNKLMLALGLLISTLMIGIGASRIVDITAGHPAIYPFGAALIGYLAGGMLVGDTAISGWVDVHLHWLQAIRLGPLEFSVAGLIGAGGVFACVRLCAVLAQRRVHAPSKETGDPPPPGILQNIRGQLAGYHLLTLLPYALVIAVIYLGHPVYVYHKHWLLKQVRYHGLSLGMTPEEVIQRKGYPPYLAEDLPDNTGQKLIAVTAMPKGKAVDDYQEWEFHIGEQAPASLEITFAGTPKLVSRIGCYSEHGYCPPVDGISTGASADEVVAKLGRPRNSYTSKGGETFDYPELHLSIMLSDHRVVMLIIHYFDTAAASPNSAATQR